MIDPKPWWFQDGVLFKIKKGADIHRGFKMPSYRISWRRLAEITSRAFEVDYGNINFEEFIFETDSKRPNLPYRFVHFRIDGADFTVDESYCYKIGI